jgi:hypothetical protein
MLSKSVVTKKIDANRKHQKNQNYHIKTFLCGIYGRLKDIIIDPDTNIFFYPTIENQCCKKNPDMNPVLRIKNAISSLAIINLENNF